MTPVMADLALARRLERAEGLANRAFVEARARRNPPSGACWREVAGTLAMFDGVASPCTQTFGLGLFDPVNSGDLDVIEEFFRERGAPVIHETCPIAQKELWPLLADRGYRPIEFTSVMVRDLSEVGIDSGTVEVSVAGEDEREVMAQTSAAGWSESMEIPADFLEMMRTISSAASVVSFLARMDGQPVAAAALNINEGVALLAGASTIPEARRRGAQRGLLMARLAYAAGVGCDLAMMGAEPGSSSQRLSDRLYAHKMAARRIIALLMPEPIQSFEKHAKLVPLFHYFLLPLALFTLIGSGVNLYSSFDDHERLYSASLIFVISLMIMMTAFFARTFALKAQDRAIRAEENLRHYVLTGKLLDRRLSVGQIVGLRFASDEEFPALAQKAAESGLAQKEIKRSVKNWRADHDRL